MNLLPFAIAWAAILVVILVLAICRRTITAKEDDTLHLGRGSDAAVTQQTAIARRLEVIDRWGKILTVLLVVLGLAIVAAYFYLKFTTDTGVQMG